MPKLVPEIGIACAEYQDRVFRNLSCKRIERDEIWQFAMPRTKNVPQSMQGQPGVGSVWTWVALDADTKLVPCWLVGNRDAELADLFMQDLAQRIANRLQLTTDGFGAYINAVQDAFLEEISYAVLVKIYGAPREDTAKYGPAECIGCKKRAISGEPDWKVVSTSCVERQNLTMRLCMRRFTRLTNSSASRPRATRQRLHSTSCTTTLLESTQR